MRGPLIMVAALIAVTAGCTNDPAGPEARKQPEVHSGGPAYNGGHTFGSGNGIAVPLDGGQTTASDSTGGTERGSGGFGSGH